MSLAGTPLIPADKYMDKLMPGWDADHAAGAKSLQDRLVEVATQVAVSSEHENTVTEALFDQYYTIPANTLKAGDLVKIRYQGIVVDSNDTDTLTIVLYLGGLAGTALMSTTAVNAEDNDIFIGDCSVIIRTAGASGTFVSCGMFCDSDAAGEAMKAAFVASTAIDTTAAQVIGVGADWSVAHADNECRLDFLSVEIHHSM